MYAHVLPTPINCLAKHAILHMGRLFRKDFTNLISMGLLARNLAQRNKVGGDGRALPWRGQVQHGLGIRSRCVHSPFTHVVAEHYGKNQAVFAT